jgi:integral membrane sensor domain MASE1
MYHVFNISCFDYLYCKAMSNFGVGVYFLTILWFITLMLCWVSIRTGHYVGKITIVISLLLTIILITLPKGETNSYSLSANFYDHLFVARYTVLTLLLISGIAGIIYCFIYVCLTPVETKKVKTLGIFN